MSFIYTRPSDNLLAVAELSAAAPDVNYPLSNMVDGFPDHPAKFTATTDAIVADFGVAKRVDAMAFYHHNLDPGVAVNLQGNATNTWGAPSLSTGIVMPARWADGYPINPWIDLKTLVPVDANRTYRYWRLVISSANSVNISIGEWGLYGTRRDFGVRNISWGSTRTIRRPAIVIETERLQRKVYDLGVSQRLIEISLEATDQSAADVWSLFRDARGVLKPFMIVPYIAEADAWLVTFANPEQPYIREKVNYNTLTILLREQARGLAP